MRIGELAHRTGASARSLRYYEQQGLLAAHRADSGQRCYGADAVERVVLIKELLGAGLSTAVIRDVLPCLEAPAAHRTPYLRERLQAQRLRLAAAAAAVQRSRWALDALLSRLAAEQRAEPGALTRAPR